MGFKKRPAIGGKYEEERKSGGKLEQASYWRALRGGQPLVGTK